MGRDLIGETVSHFRITAKLGEGGMGQVYLAQDAKLKRKVALKVLPAEMAGNEDRLGRFHREAEAIAALNHPNIVQIYSVDEADGIHYLTMELVDGKPLNELIPDAGFPLSGFFEIAVPLSDALAAAHAKGITHRDLKPANIMVTAEDRRVKVLDFGLAKLAPSIDGEDPGATQLATLAMTQEGLVIGTVPYMSPEQLEAKPVDQRTDIFSLGVVLFEMATGKRPFESDSAAGLMSSILTHRPEPVTVMRGELPRHLGRIIGRCLEKDPKERFQTARDVHNELRSLRQEVESGTAYVTGSAPAARPGRGRGRWIGAAAAIALLAAVLAVWVASSRPGSGRPGARQGEPVTRAEPTALPADPYQATVEARALLDHYYREGNVDRAIRLFEHALSLDPDNAVAYSGLAQAFVWKNFADPDVLWLDRALDAAASAQELADQIAATHLALGVVRRERGEIESALAEIEQAVELDPLNATAHRELAVARAVAGEAESALASYATALELDPEDWLTLQRLGQQQYRMTRFEEAETSFRKALELAPDYVSAHRSLAAVYHMQGRFEEAAAELQRSLEIEPSDQAYSNLGTLQFFLGRYGAAAEAFEKAIELGAANYPYWGNLGDAYRWAPGQRERAEPAYRRALELGQEQLDRSPDNADLRAELALYRVKVGERERAVAEVEKALATAGSDPWIMAMAAVVYELSGHRSAALSALGKAIEAGYSTEELKREPELIELRRDPQYHRLMLKLNSSREQS